MTCCALTSSQRPVLTSVHDKASFVLALAINVHETLHPCCRQISQSLDYLSQDGNIGSCPVSYQWWGQLQECPEVCLRVPVQN